MSGSDCTIVCVCESTAVKVFVRCVTLLHLVERSSWAVTSSPSRALCLLRLSRLSLIWAFHYLIEAVEESRTIGCFCCSLRYFTSPHQL